MLPEGMPAAAARTHLQVKVAPSSLLRNWSTTLPERRTASGASVMVATGGVESR